LNSTPNTYGKRIKAARVAAGMSQAALAADAGGMAAPLLSAIERGAVSRIVAVLDDALAQRAGDPVAQAARGQLPNARSRTEHAEGLAAHFAGGTLMTVDSRSPARNRASRTPTRTIGRFTAMPGEYTFTLAGGDLDSLQTGDVVRVVDVAGGDGVEDGASYVLFVDTSSSFRLETTTGEPVLVTNDARSGTLQYGQLDPAGYGQANFVPQNSVLGRGPHS